METVFIYLLKMVACSAVMFAYYLLFLRDKTFHHYNRFYLLSTVLASILLPLLKLDYFTIETDSRVLLLMNQWNSASEMMTASSWSAQKILLMVSGGVSFVLVIKILAGILKILQMEKKYPKKSLEGISFYNTDLPDAPFSFFRNLFWKDSILLQSDLGRQILKHEMVHIEQKHSIDKLFMHLVQSVFWLNPVFYFIRQEMSLIHEYLADKKALQHSDTKAFAQMLLASRFSGNILPAANPFLSSNLKKRLLMLTKQNSKFSYARRILALPILFAVSFALLVNAKNKEIKKQNHEIAFAVKQLSIDTLKPKDLQRVIASNHEKINKASEKLKKDNEKIKLLSDETQKKAEELEKIAKEKGDKSYEFELKTKELEQLGKEIEKIAQSEKFQRNLKDLEFHVADLDKYLDSEEFKKHFEGMEGKGIKFPKGDQSKRFHVESQFHPMDFKKIDPETLSQLTKEQQKALKKINKEREATAKKQAEIIRKQAELAKEEAKILGDKMKFFRGAMLEEEPGTKKMIIRGKAIKMVNTDAAGNAQVADDTRIYINGKPATKEEMNKLDPKDIVSVNVNKNNNNGEENNEIRIQTK